MVIGCLVLLFVGLLMRWERVRWFVGSFVWSVAIVCSLVRSFVPSLARQFKIDFVCQFMAVQFITSSI